MNYSVTDTALNSYNQIYYDKLTRLVINLVNESFMYDKEASLKFFDTHAISVQINDGTITDVKKLSYDDIIPDNFLNKLRSLPHLPPRLNRLKSLGNSYLREELIESLQLGRIKLSAKSNVADWEIYGISFVIEENFCLADIVTE